MSRRVRLVALALVTLALGGFLLAKDGDRKDAGGPGIVGFEFAWDEEGATEILADWGDEGTDAARTSLAASIAYLLAGLAARLRPRYAGGL